MRFDRDKHGTLYVNGRRVFVKYLRGDWVWKKDPTLVSGRRKEFYPGPVGAVVGLVVDGKIKVGFSKVNCLSGDKFDKHKSLLLAVERALNSGVLTNIPFGVEDELEKMYYRCLGRNACQS